MSNNFRVGQKVVCIREPRTIAPNVTCDGPTKGRVYQISEVIVAPWGEPSVKLVEFPQDVGMVAKMFRPAVDKPASIEVFRKMLTPEKVNA